MIFFVIIKIFLNIKTVINKIILEFDRYNNHRHINLFFLNNLK